MDQLKGLPLGRQIILGAGVLLLIDTFLDWQQVSVFTSSVGQSAWHGFWGVVMGLALIVLLAWTIVKAFEIDIPVNVPDGLTSLGLAVLILVFAFIKAISDSYVHWPAWAGVVLAAVMTYGAWLVYAASENTLPSMSSMGGGGGGGGSTTTDSAPPSAPPSTEE